MHRRRITYRLNGEISERGGVVGNRGNLQGQIVRSNDGADHTISECWELLFIANAMAPAPYKFTDEELKARMYELFPQREGTHNKDGWKIGWWRLYYNQGVLYCQRARDPDLLPTPPDPELHAYRYIRTPVPDEPGKWPFSVAATTSKGRHLFSVYPPEPKFRYEKLKFMFRIPKQDWSEFPFPKEARNLYREIKKERLEKERMAFQAFCQEWMAKQKVYRPQDFDPLLWKDPKW